MKPTHHSINVSRTLWQFLNQPLFSSTKVILNPFQFWRQGTAQYLEQCWNRDLVQLLERCWAQKFELKSPADQSFQP
ncbi:MAG: hypothetical protein ACAF41_03165 [Leptolyngbya sp. BL-A-14]